MASKIVSNAAHKPQSNSKLTKSMQLRRKNISRHSREVYRNQYYDNQQQYVVGTETGYPEHAHTQQAPESGDQPQFYLVNTKVGQGESLTHETDVRRSDKHPISINNGAAETEFLVSQDNE